MVVCTACLLVQRSANHDSAAGTAQTIRLDGDMLRIRMTSVCPYDREDLGSDRGLKHRRRAAAKRGRRCKKGKMDA